MCAHKVAGEGTESSGQAQEKGKLFPAPPILVPASLSTSRKGAKGMLAVDQNELGEVQTSYLTIRRKWAQRNFVVCSRPKSWGPESRLMFSHVTLIITVIIDTY